jgi:hypothetical protein
MSQQLNITCQQIKILTSGRMRYQYPDLRAYVMPVSGADPGFVVKGGVSRRGVWGPFKVPSWSRVEPW